MTSFSPSPSPRSYQRQKQKIRELLRQFPFIEYIIVQPSSDSISVTLCPKSSHKDSRLSLVYEQFRENLTPTRIEWHIAPKGTFLFPLNKNETLIRVDSIYRSPTRAKSNRYSSDDLIKEVRRAADKLGIEVFDGTYYKIPLGDQSIRFLVVRAYIPSHVQAWNQSGKKSSLEQWRLDFEDQHDLYVFFDCSTAFSQAEKLLSTISQGQALLTDRHLEEIFRTLHSLFGMPPSQNRVCSYPNHLLDLRSIPFCAIDSEEVQDREDLVHAEQIDDMGSILLRIAFIDVTWFVTPKSAFYRYARKIGATAYGSSQSFPTLGSSIAAHEASFRLEAERPAWVVDILVSKEGEISHSTIHQALVKTHRYIDPIHFGSLARDPSSPSFIKALHEASSRLKNRRMKKTRFFLIEGESTGSQVVAETMIAAKTEIARILEKSGKSPVYKIHSLPAEDDREYYATEVRALGIPADPTHFIDPSQFAGILQALERQGAYALQHRIINSFLPRSIFSIENKGHYGIGADAYCEIKPREFIGIVTQFDLASLRDPHFPTLSTEEKERRADRRNRQRRTSASLAYKLRFLEMLFEKLALVGEEFTGIVKEIESDRIRIEVPNFSFWGIIYGKIEDIKIGAALSARLKGFHIEEKRFEFASAGSLPNPSSLPISLS